MAIRANVGGLGDTSTATATSITATFSGASVGDGALVAVSTNNGTDNFTTPTNWTLLGASPYTQSGNLRVFVFGRTALTSTEIASGVVFGGVTGGRLVGAGHIYVGSVKSFGVTGSDTFDESQAAAASLTLATLSSTAQANDDVSVIAFARLATASSHSVISLPAAFTKDNEKATNLSSSPNYTATVGHLTTTVAAGSSVGGGSITTSPSALQMIAVIVEILAYPANVGSASAGSDASGTSSAATVATGSGAAAAAGSGSATATTQAVGAAQSGATGSGASAVTTVAAGSGSGSGAASGAGTPTTVGAGSATATTTGAGAAHATTVASAAGQARTVAAGDGAPNVAGSVSGDGSSRTSAGGTATVTTVGAGSGAAKATGSGAAATTTVGAGSAQARTTGAGLGGPIMFAFGSATATTTIDAQGFVRGSGNGAARARADAGGVATVLPPRALALATDLLDSRWSVGRITDRWDAEVVDRWSVRVLEEP